VSLWLVASRGHDAAPGLDLQAREDLKALGYIP
jgi:hypothetical protein